MCRQPVSVNRFSLCHNYSSLRAENFVCSGTDACFSILSPFLFIHMKLQCVGVASSQRDTLSPEIANIKKFKSMLRPAKRARSVENHEFDLNGMFLLF